MKSDLVEWYKKSFFVFSIDSINFFIINIFLVSNELNLEYQVLEKATNTFKSVLKLDDLINILNLRNFSTIFGLNIFTAAAN